MSGESNVNRFIADLAEYLRLEHYISPQTIAEMFEIMDRYGQWPEHMNERPIIDDLLDQGMPEDRPMIRVYMSGRAIYEQAARSLNKSVNKAEAEKMNSYIVLSFGVLAERDEVMKYNTGSSVSMDLGTNETKVRLHVWRQSLFCRNVWPRYESFFIAPGSPAAQHYKRHNWWGRVENLDYKRRDMLNALVDGFNLLGKTAEMVTKPPRGGPNRTPDYPWHDENKRETFIDRVNQLHSKWAKALNSQMEKEFEHQWINMLSGNSDFHELPSTLLREAIKKRITCREKGIAITEEYQARAYAMKQAAIELGVTRTKGTKKEQPYAYVTLKKYYDGTLPQINAKKKSISR